MSTSVSLLADAPVDRLVVLLRRSGALPLPFTDCSWRDFGRADEKTEEDGVYRELRMGDAFDAT